MRWSVTAAGWDLSSIPPYADELGWSPPRVAEQVLAGAGYAGSDADWWTWSCHPTTPVRSDLGWFWICWRAFEVIVGAMAALRGLRPLTADLVVGTTMVEVKVYAQPTRWRCPSSSLNSRGPRPSRCAPSGTRSPPLRRTTWTARTSRVTAGPAPASVHAQGDVHRRTRNSRRFLSTVSDAMVARSWTCEKRCRGPTGTSSSALTSSSRSNSRAARRLREHRCEEPEGPEVQRGGSCTDGHAIGNLAVPGAAFEVLGGDAVLGVESGIEGGAEGCDQPDGDPDGRSDDQKLPARVLP